MIRHEKRNSRRANEIVTLFLLFRVRAGGRRGKRRVEWRVTKVVSGRGPQGYIHTFRPIGISLFLSLSLSRWEEKKGQTSVVQTHPRWWLTAWPDVYLRGPTGEGNRLIRDIEPARLPRGHCLLLITLIHLIDKRESGTGYDSAIWPVAGRRAPLSRCKCFFNADIRGAVPGRHLEIRRHCLVTL